MLYNSNRQQNTEHEMRIVILTEDAENMHRALERIKDVSDYFDGECYIDGMRSVNEEGDMEDFSWLDSPFCI